MSESEQQVNQRKKQNNKESQEATQAQLLAKKALAKKCKKTSFFVEYSYHIVVVGFLVLCLVAFGSTFFQDRRKLSVLPVIDQEKIDIHNSEEHSYKLGANQQFLDWTLADAKTTVQTTMTKRSTLPRCATQEESTIIPETYNFRTAHPECAKPIYNQGNCSSSYAVASVSSFQDRLCQQNNGRVTVSLSSQSVVSCDPKRNAGCKGGSVSGAFDYGKRDGYLEESQLPYTGDWKATCPNNFGSAKRYFVQDYCVVSSEEGIKREVLKNGPVVVVIPVYRDFLVYQSGTYDVEEGSPKIAGGQAVKIIGWNKDEDNVGYWIVENSWGESWGLNGFANIAVGQRQLYIDEFAVGASPKAVPTENEAKVAEPVQTNQKADETQAEEVDLD